MKIMRRLFREERGAVLVYVSLFMIVLLGSAGGVMDIGMLYENRRQLQNGADGAALAGAQELLRFELSVGDRQTLAINTALDYAQRNGISVSQIDAGYPQVLCVPFPYNNNCDPSNEHYYNAVKVSASRYLDLLVAGLMNNNLGDVGAFATGIAAPMIPTQGVWPWGVSNCDDWDGDADPILECGVPEGQRVVLKMSAPPGSPGNYFALDFPNSAGGSGYGDNIQDGYGNESGDYIKPSLPWCGQGDPGAGCTGVDDPYVQTKTGNNVGTTRAAVDYLINMAASSGQDDPASAINEPVDRCTWPGAPKSPSDPDVPPPAGWVGNVTSCYRIGIVPIIYQRWTSLSGNKPVDIVHWGTFYLIGRTTGPGGQLQVWGYYSNEAILGGGRFSDTDTGLWSVRLWE